MSAWRPKTTAARPLFSAIFWAIEPLDGRPVAVAEPAAVLGAAVLRLRPPPALCGHGRVLPDAAEAGEGVAQRPGAAAHAVRLRELAAERVAGVLGLAEASAAASERGRRRPWPLGPLGVTLLRRSPAGPETLSDKRVDLPPQHYYIPLSYAWNLFGIKLGRKESMFKPLGRPTIGISSHRVALRCSSMRSPEAMAKQPHRIRIIGGYKGVPEPCGRREKPLLAQFTSILCHFGAIQVAKPRIQA